MSKIGCTPFLVSSCTQAPIMMCALCAAGLESLNTCSTSTRCMPIWLRSEGKRRNRSVTLTSNPMPGALCQHKPRPVTVVSNREGLRHALDGLSAKVGAYQGLLALLGEKGSQAVKHVEDAEEAGGSQRHAVLCCYGDRAPCDFTWVHVFAPPCGFNSCCLCTHCLPHAHGQERTGCIDRACSSAPGHLAYIALPSACRH